MKNFVAGAVLFLIVVVGANSVFVVKETERAVMLQFGNIVDTDIPPGLHFKVPYVNSVRKFDARILTVDATPQRYLTLEQKALLVDSYAMWRITDVERFYTATSGDESRANALLAQRVNDGLRNKFGERDLQEVVSGQRDALMNELTTELNTYVANEYGIEVIDVRVKRIDLPDDVRSSVYERMTSERQREAQQLRSRGNELAIGIEADADRQEAVLLVEAYRDSERIRGDGDATAAAIYSAAYTQDPEFYSFTRSLNSYRDTFSSKSDVMLLDPESDYFKYLRSDEAL
ncbi:protease modulator HflC [Pseudohongiella sp.]|uniref:Band 7 domain-containing protein n=1 Tax=marine sediment metagenome TaxID=412755 RepID=A0A0F9YQJ1_9ZZZZ|nr:protease modulator HflC [Pseudohongiella sp.]HDZ10185.1 protease modulator HflC [Pseudohongiella sp.]HEA64283.1 protease modulator HflC [Pseudohongiella sp.]